MTNFHWNLLINYLDCSLTRRRCQLPLVTAMLKTFFILSALVLVLRRVVYHTSSCIKEGGLSYKTLLTRKVSFYVNNHPYKSRGLCLPPGAKPILLSTDVRLRFSKHLHSYIQYFWKPYPFIYFCWKSWPNHIFHNSVINVINAKDNLLY
jgi:hypothetical protein